MNILRRDDIEKLMDSYEGPCVSVFMPSHRGATESRQDQIRFKNLLREAEESLLESGLRHPQVNDLLEPVQMLLKDASFWKQQIDGLAVFLCQDIFQYFCFPHRFKELVVVTDRFHIKPLLPLFSGEKRFYLLALSQNQVRLFQGSRYSIVKVDLEGVPDSLAEAVGYDEREKQLQSHTRSPGSGGGRGAIFRGHGEGTDNAKDKILEYFRQINKGLQQLLKDEKAPLVLAGVEYLFPIYREANTYPHLADDGVTGNPEGLSAEDLHEQAWAIVAPLFNMAERDSVKYRKFAGSEKTSTDVRKIVPAAYYGRVESLIVAVGVQQWGTFDPVRNVVQLHQEAQPGDADLLDFAAIQTFLLGGSVYAVEPNQVPDEAPLAAVFRY
ncbi:MAG: hypothetical protein JRJ86_20305 [Deltaproteobacteria bacterium]|nr:hypothetical protein [Deltaproteobacteria bacterium]